MKTQQEKIYQITKLGTGVGTSFLCQITGLPFIIIAADEDDLERILIKRCQTPKASFTKSKFRKLKVQYSD